MYTIRQAEASDWPAIERFVAATYGATARYKGLARWRWQLEQAPYARADGALLPSWIALRGSEVVGQISLQPGRLWIGEREEEIGWIVDVMVHPDHRGAGLGHRIYRAIHDSGRTAITLTMADATRRMAERVDCVTLAPVEHLVRIERLSAATATSFVLARTEPRAHLRRLGRLLAARGPGPGILALLATLAARLLHVPARQAQLERDVVEVDRFAPQDVTAIAASMRAKLPAMFDRSAAFCTWRFDAVPDLSYGRAQRLVDGGVAGLIVWRLPQPDELRVGTIVDILADPEDRETIEVLVSHAIARMAGGCDAIVAGGAHPAFVGPLKRLGFFAMRRHRPTVTSLSRAVLERCAAVGAGWHMSKADHDWDQVHPIEH